MIFAAVRKWNVADPELLFAVYRAFNDYAMEVNTIDPDRIFMLPTLPTKYPEECVRELERMILDTLRERDPESSICPSEIARRSADQQGREEWRSLLEPVRRAGRRLAAVGAILVSRNGVTVDAATASGPIRYRLHRETGPHAPELP